MTTHDEWKKRAHQLNRIHRSAPFWIRDSILEAERRFSENVAIQLIDDAFPDINEALREKYRAVALAYPPGERFEKLTFTHHHLCLRKYLTPSERRAHLEFAATHDLNTTAFKSRLMETRQVKAVLRPMQLGDAIDKFRVLANRWPVEHREVWLNLCREEAAEQLV